MARLRTYRILSLFAALTLLIGAAAPAVQAICATPPSGTMMSGREIMSGRDEQVRVPCHHPEADEPVLGVETASTPSLGQVPVRCDANPSGHLHLCCPPDGNTSSPATLLSDSAPRALDLAFAVVLLDGMGQASVEPSILPSTRAGIPSFTSTPLRQALLATFLI